MDALTEGAHIVYQLSAEDAENINTFAAAHPDRIPAGPPAMRGQRVPATVLMTLGPKQAGPERLTVRLDGPDRGYHVGAADLVFADGAWRKPETTNA